MSNPLLGFSPPSWPSSSLHQGPLGRWHLSWDFFPLQRFGRRESTSQPVARPGSPSFLGRLSTAPTLPTTVPLSGFPNLAAAFFLPSPSCHISDRWRSWVLPFRGLLLASSPDDSSSPACPLDVSPVGWPPRPRIGHLWANWLLPRMYPPVPLFVFRAFVYLQVGLLGLATISNLSDDLPLMGFFLLMGSIAPSAREA